MDLRERGRPAEVEEEPPPTPEPVRVRITESATCPLCLEALTQLPRLEVCPACQTIHHWSCVEELGRCGTISCEGLSRAELREPERDQRLLATIAHLVAVFGGGFVGPLLIWLATRDKHQQRFAAHHAKQAFVFSLLSIPMSLTVVLIPVAIALFLRAAHRAYRGDWRPYPFAFLDRWVPPPQAPSPGSGPKALAGPKAAPKSLES